MIPSVYCKDPSISMKKAVDDVCYKGNSLDVSSKSRVGNSFD